MKSKGLRRMAILTSLIVATFSFGLLTQAKTIETKDTLKKEISKKNDADFDKYMTEYMKKSYDNKKTKDAIKKELSEVGIELLSYTETVIPKETEETKATDNYEKASTQEVEKNTSLAAGSSMVAYATYDMPSAVTVLAYSAKRIGDTYYRLYTQVTHKYTLTNCGSLDLLTVEWDPTLFKFYNYGSTYYDNSGAPTSFITLQNGDYKSKGVLLFNVEDVRMSYGDYVAGVAYVTPIGKGEAEHGGKYVHTYNSTQINWSVGYNVKYTSSAAIEAGFTISIDSKQVPDQWQVPDYNAITLQ